MHIFQRGYSIQKKKYDFAKTSVHISIVYIVEEILYEFGENTFSSERKESLEKGKEGKIKRE
jgi:hypothetical protein